MQKPLIVKGTRDFSPLEMIKRNYIFDTIKNVYKLYGFQQIETPSMENLSTLMGKYGEEGDRLIFKILNSGDFLSSFAGGELNDITSLKFAAKACEKGLRYDLTVPFARYVVMHRNDIVFPFKRFQIQPVWRADRPQKGRYREFYQCDADIIGSDSLLNEVELIQIIDEVFSRFNIRIAIKLNNRKILSGMAEYIGEKDKITDITVAIDKYEKIGLEQVNKELESKGLSKDAIDKLQPIILLEGTNREKLHSLKGLLSCSETGTNGIDELIYILDIIEQQPLKSDIDIDLTLARGLNYYTGAIIEVKALDVEIGSITGGGRYDDLTGVFGLDNMSGVGISFGADRIYDVLNQLDLYPTQMAEGTNVLISNMGNKELSYLMPIATKLRQKGISVEIYPDSVKLKKQLTYANSKHIKFVVIAGENEISNNLVSLKDMVSGEQKNITARELQDEIQLYFSR